MITNTKRLKLNISYINRPLRAWGCLHNDVRCHRKRSIPISARGDKYFLPEVSSPSGLNVKELKLHVARLSIPVNLPHLFWGIDCGQWVGEREIRDKEILSGLEMLQNSNFGIIAIRA